MGRLQFSLACSVPIVSFLIIGCNKTEFSPKDTSLAALVAQGSGISPTVQNTTKNQAKSFAAGQINGKTMGQLSFDKKPGTTTLTTTAGTYTITNPETFQITFTPAFEYVGTDVVTVYTTDEYGNSIKGRVTMQVGNILNKIQPALAVRGISCITCHSVVSSNMVTDYGFGTPWSEDSSSPNDSPYLDRITPNVGYNGLATLKLENNSTLYVPVAPFNISTYLQYVVTNWQAWDAGWLNSMSAADRQSAIADYSTQFSQIAADTTLQSFIQTRFSQSKINSSSQVQQINSLTIQEPTAAQIQAAFKNPTGVQVYIPDTQNSPQQVQGLDYDSVNQVFKISNLVCDGDLYLARTVFFANNATVQSINGCRIYATQSIFIDGALNAIPFQGSANYNIQLMSARSIWVGVGKMSMNGNYCEKDSNGKPTGWYVGSTAVGGAPVGIDCSTPANQNWFICDSYTARAWVLMDKNAFSMAYPTYSALLGAFGMAGSDAVQTMSVNTTTNVASLVSAGTTGDAINKIFSGTIYSNPQYPTAGGVPDGSVTQERHRIEQSIGRSLYDSSCSPAGRNVATSRLLLVAPYVNDRLTGQFSGSVVADVAIMSLGSFKFQFDPIFKTVSIFSQLPPNSLISGSF